MRKIRQNTKPPKTRTTVCKKREGKGKTKSTNEKKKERQKPKIKILGPKTQPQTFKQNRET